MKLLLVSDNLAPAGSNEACNINIVQSLQRLFPQLALYAPHKSAAKLFPALTVVDSAEELNACVWDLIILLDILDSRIMDSINKGTPCLLFITSSHNAVNMGSLPDIYKVIIPPDFLPLHHTGIPHENILPLAVNFYNKIARHNKHIKNPQRFVYFIDPSDRDLKNSRTIMRAFNGLPYLKLIIVGTETQRISLEYQANSNIKFSKKMDGTGTKPGHNAIVIASKKIAEKAVMCKMPVIVAGINGFGGLVSSDTIDDFARTGFKGRIGGSEHEIIPLKLLEKELLYARDQVVQQQTKMKVIVADTSYAAFARSYSIDFKKVIDEIIAEILQLSRCVQNKQSLLSLFPKIPLIIQFQKYSSTEWLVTNASSGKYITLISEEQFSLLTLCKGKECIQSLIQENRDLSAKETSAFLLTMWRKKVVLLSKSRY